MILVALAFIPAAPAATGLMPHRPEGRWRAPGYDPGTLIVKFRDATTAERIRELAEAGGATLRRPPERDGLAFLDLGASASVFDALARFERLPEVEYAAPNLYAEAFFVPNDTLIGKVDYTWYLRSVGAYDAWDVVTGDPSVVLAIIDTGVAFEDHPVPEYERKKVRSTTTMYRRSPELPGPFLPGWDFVNNDAHPNDDAGHGTEVATVAAGAANNLAGSAGIAFGVTILPIKVLDFNQQGDMEDLVLGIRFAADQGADVANLSLGFKPFSKYRQEGWTQDSLAHFFRPLRDAVNYARRRGTILVAASGNFGTSEVSLPAGYPGVISVGATGYSDSLADYSSYGKGLSFVAPGGTDRDENDDGLGDHIPILSIRPNWTGESADDFLAVPDEFVVWHAIGTSFAAPHVSGAVALLMSLGLKDQGTIEQTLRATARMPDGNPHAYSEKYGSGLIQIDQAVRKAVSIHHGGPAGRPSSDRVEARIVTGNPARGSARIAFRTSRHGPLDARVYDAGGRLVRVLARAEAPAGPHDLRWDGRDDTGAAVASGVYFLRVNSPDGTAVRKIAFLR